MSGELRRGLGMGQALGIGLGSMIGAGLFVVLGLAAGIAGPGFLIGILLAGVGATCNALSSANLAAVYPRAGGTYEYGNRLLNPWLGFAAGWMFLMSKFAAGGTVAIGFGSYLAKLTAVDPRWAGIAASMALLAANLLGIRKAGWLNLAIVSITLGALVYLLLSIGPAFEASKLVPLAPGGVGPIVQSAALLFFAFTGYARLATLGEEVVDPQRTIPRAVVWSIAIVIVLYLAVGIAGVGAIGAEGLAATNSPLEAAARHGRLLGTPAVIVIGACAAMLGVLLSQILGISRMMFAMARGGDLPSLLGKTNAQDVPHLAVLATGAVLLLVAWFGKLASVAAAASFSILLYYGIANWAALRLEPKDRMFPTWVPILGLILCAGLALSLPFTAIASGAIVLLAGFAWRGAFRRLERPA